MSRKTNHLKLHLPDPNEYYDIELDQNQNFEIIDEVLTPATKSELENILNQNLIKDILELATEQDVRNLFVGTVLEGGTTYNLSSLSTDESKVVNMRLLSLFNDLLLQKISDKDNDLSKELKSLINLKEDKTKVAELISSLRTELTNSINTKANKTILINVGAGLKGGGNLGSNISINMDYSTIQEINEVLNQSLIKEVFELATEQNIRNLFVETRLEGGTEYKLSVLSTDESKIVNMKLLSLFNDLILQKVGNNSSTLKNELTNLINSTKTRLENSISLKEDKNKVTEYINNLNQSINSKANSNITVSAGKGLLGGGKLTENITFSLNYGTTEEIQNILK